MSIRQKVLFAVMIPVVALMGITALKHYRVKTGAEVTLAISGYDPRDLLSGHYLIYRVDYGVDGICRKDLYKDHAESRDAYVCLQPKQFTYYRPDSEKCRILIKGRCERSRFVAGIERFYIPEEYSKKLDEMIRDKKAAIVVSVKTNGEVSIVDLTFEGMNWKDYLKK